jgi:hypothetical protein
MSFSSQLQAAAQAAAQAMYNSDGSINSSACAQVCVNGSAANSAVHAFKVAWNTEGWGSDSSSSANGAQGAPANAPDPAFGAIGSLGHNGQYDNACAQAIGAVANISPAQPCPGPCSGGGGGSGPSPAPGPITPPSNGGLSKGVKILIFVLVGAAVLGLGWYLWRRFGSRSSGAVGEPSTKRKHKHHK